MRVLRALGTLGCVVLVVGGIGYVAWRLLRVDPEGAQVRQITISSRYVHARLPVVLVTPPEAARDGVC